MKEIEKKEQAEVSGGAIAPGRPSDSLSPPPFNPILPTDPIAGPTPTEQAS